MNYCYILLIIALFLAIANAGKGKRKVARHQRRCDAAQGPHIAAIMSTNELDINSRDFYCRDNLRGVKVEMCKLIHDHLDDEEKKPNIFENIKKFYMDRVYTKENFPITYRPYAKLGTISETVLDEFYNDNCSQSRQGNMSSVLVFLGLLFMTTLALIR
jgi:hypothetical protein